MENPNETEGFDDSQAETVDARDYKPREGGGRDRQETPAAETVSSDWAKSNRWEGKIAWMFLSVYGDNRKGCDAQVEGVFELPSGHRMLIRAKPYHEGGRFPQKGDTFEEIQPWAIEIAEAITEALDNWAENKTTP